jgi:hypothetical protein
MAYNPFDDVIENDPAYKMQIGGIGNNPVREIPMAKSPIESNFEPTVGTVAAKDLDAFAGNYMNPIVNTFGDLFAQSIGRVADAMVNEEEAAKGRKKFQDNREVQNFLGKVPQQITPEDNELAFKRIGKEYQPLNFKEGFNQFTGFFLEDGIKGSNAITQEGKRFSELPGMQQFGLAVLPFEFMFGLFAPAREVKNASKLVSNFGKNSTVEVMNDPQFRAANPQLVKIIEDEMGTFTGGGFQPKGVAFAKEDGMGAGPSSLYKQYPGDKNNTVLGQWRRQTIQTYLDELRKQAGDPNAKFDKSIVIQELTELFKSLGVPADKFISKKGKNTYFERAFGQRKKDGTKERPFDKYFYAEKQAGGTTPSWAKPNYKPDQPGNPTYQFLKNKVAEYMKTFPNAEKPSSREIFNYIQQTETDEVKQWFASRQGSDKGELSKISDILSENRREGVEGVDELLRPTKISSTKLLLDDLFEKDPAFKSSFDVAVDTLQDDNFLNRIVNAWESNLAKYKDDFGRPILSLDNFTRYGNENNLWPKRMNQMEKVSYSPDYKSTRDLNREVDRLGNMLISGPDSREYKKFGTQIRIEDDIYSYLTHKYRTIRDFEKSEDLKKGVGLSANDFMETYVMPFKGKDRLETIENLKKEYTDFGKYWEPMEREFDEYNDLLDQAMDGLEASGKYTTDELNKIRKSLSPNRSHLFPVNQANKEKRFLNLSGDGRFIEVQPVYINNSLEPIYRNLLTKVFNKLETADSIAQLKVQKPKFFGMSKNRSEYADLDISQEAFKNTFTNPGDFNQYNYLNFVYQQIDAAMKDKGIISYQIFNPKNKNIIQGFKVKEGEAGDLLVVGSDVQFTPADHINRALKQLEESGIPDVFNPTKKTSILKFKKRGGISMVKGGVQMAIGGQNFTENMNKQDFIPDPAIDGDSAFQQAVQSGNLTALNLPKIFKGLGEAFGVFTPKKVGKPLTGEMSAVSPVAKSDFPLQSFTLEKINNLNIQSARPQDWINELQGGAPAPKSELLDSGLFQYLADFEKYFPNQKVSKDKLVEFLEDNPISNLKIKIKGSETGDPAYDSYMGKPRHKNAGSARMDQAGEDYREVILEAGTLPGQQTGDEFVNSSHFQEKNVLAFGRVGTYKNSAGDNVAVIQEMQTDYLTQVRKEQELLNAEIEKLNLQKTKAEQRLERAESPYDIQRANESLAEVNSKLPALLKLQESKLIKPYPNVAAADKIPEFNKQLQDLQKQINNLSMQGVRRENPEFLMQISNLEEQQKQVLNQLLDLNRANEYEMLAKDVKVPDIDDRDNLLRYINGSDSYVGMKNVKTFPPTPLNNQADYVDAIIKAVIKDAENRGINRVTIMPANVGANVRWSKESDDARKKFINLYDKVGVQRLKDIAKKYGGTVEEQFILDTTKGELGLRFLNKDVDGNFQVLKETDIDPSVTIRREDLGPSKPPEGLNAFLNEEILRVAKDYGPNEVVFRKEIAPGQTMEYFVNVKQGDVVDQKFDLVPLGDADRAENATIVIEEYNPQLVKMNVLVLPDSNKDKPMYLFKKKKGGIMPDDRLVSITDIYGDY